MLSKRQENRICSSQERSTKEEWKGFEKWQTSSSCLRMTQLRREIQALCLAHISFTQVRNSISWTFLKKVSKLLTFPGQLWSLQKSKNRPIRFFSWLSTIRKVVTSLKVQSSTCSMIWRSIARRGDIANCLYRLDDKMYQDYVYSRMH